MKIVDKSNGGSRPSGTNVSAGLLHVVLNKWSARIKM